MTMVTRYQKDDLASCTYEDQTSAWAIGATHMRRKSQYLQMVGSSLGM